MTDEEKERATLAGSGKTELTEDAGTQSVDAAPVDKMAKGPSKKKSVLGSEKLEEPHHPAGFFVG